jgi:6-pyruvoyltetrahydropterin/6-carboxytetrahydropterin synthase
MFELKLMLHFSAAHRLRDYSGKCESNHGHNWKVEVVLRAPETDNRGMVMDFNELRERLEGVLEGFDHKCLNDVKPFDVQNPTTENISREIYNRLAAVMPENIKIASVTSFETDNCGATYYED